MRDHGLTGREAALYEMIWKRAVASQMENARGTNITVRVDAGDARHPFRGPLRTELAEPLDPVHEVGHRQLPVHILLSKADKFNRQEQVLALRALRMLLGGLLLEDAAQ